MDSVYRRTLSRAAEILGGEEALRAYLRVPMHRLEAWLAGERPPVDIFLRAVDAISASSAHAVLQRSIRLQQSSTEIVRQSQRLLDEASAIQRTVGTMRRHAGDDFFGRSFALADRREVLEAALEAAISATGADKGTVQLASAEGLRIVAQRGFERPFLEYFAVLAGSARRVVVSDVATHELFAGTPAAEVMEAAGVRAFQSTPLIAASGWMLGMISTHFSEPQGPSDEALARVDLIARRTAAWLEAATAPGR